MICNLLMRLGIPFGNSESFFRTDKWNSKGYFEQNEIMYLNSRIVTGFSRTQNSLQTLMCKIVYSTMPNMSKVKKRAKKYEDEIIRLGLKYDDIAVKDPRFCLTLNCWQKYANIDKCVICLRHPLETVMSLYYREHYPMWLGFKFWEYHISNLMTHFPLTNCLLIDFNKLASDNYEQELVLIKEFFGFEFSINEMSEQYRSCFSPHLLRFTAPPLTKLPPKTEKLWHELRELREN